MPDDGERLVVLLEARLTDFERNMLKAAGISRTQFKAIQDSSKSATNQMAADMVRSTTRINQALAQSSTRMGEFGKAMGIGNQRVIQLTQRMDHLQSAFSGNQSPFQIAIQQAAHFNELLAGSTMGEAAGAIGGAFMGMLNPMNLVIVGLIAAGAYAVKFFDEFITGSSASKEEQEKQAKAAEDLAKNWGDALTALQAYQEAKAKQQSDTSNKDAYSSSTNDAQAKATEALRNANVALAGVFSIAQYHAPVADLNKFKQGLNELAAAGTDTNKILQASYHIQAAMATLAADTGSPAIQKLAASFGDLLDKASAATTTLQDLNAQASAINVVNSFEDMSRAIAEIDPSKANGRLKDVSKAVTDLENELRTGQITIEDFDRSIDSISAANPDVSMILDKIKSIGDAAATARAQVAGLVNEGGKDSRLKSMDQAQAEYDQSYNMARRFGDLSDLDTPKKPKEPKAARTTRAPRQNPFQRGMQQSEDRTKEIEAETAAQASLNPLINDYGVALATAREKQKLINDAEKAHIALTPDVVASIDAQAAAYGNAVGAANKLSEMQNKLRQSMEKWRDVSKGALGTFIDDLEQGKSVGQAFGDVLKDIAAQLEKMALNNLFGQSGSNNWFSSLFSSLLGGAFRFPAAPTGPIVSGMSLQDWGFDTGGYTGPGGKYQPAGIVHKGEVVFSQADVARHGGVAAVEALRRGLTGYASGGVVGGGASAGSSAFTFAPVTHIDARGSNMNEAQMQKILDQRDKSLKDQIQKELPDRLVNARKTSIKVQRAFG